MTKKVSLVIAIIGAALSAAPIVFAQDQKATTEATEGCLGCHGERGEHIKFSDGSSKSVHVSRDEWLGSVHGGKLACTDCHREISGYPHRKQKFQDARDYTLARANTCQRCHYAHYTRVLDSTHYEILKEGIREAPTCVDCHGSHGIKTPGKPRLSVNQKCANCHTKISEAFSKSVHGKALSENNEDVPACTDCHGAHSISSPAKAEFRLNQYKLCAHCHGDAEKMKKYNLNPDVTKTYLDDFHGSSNRLYAMGAGTPTKPIATCSDCHGVHDIMSFRANSANPAEVKERVVNTCRKCHAKVPTNFADAWLSHYEPTFKTAPLVWAVKLGYQILIPMIMAGLVLHILLHLWRWKNHR